MGFFRIELGRNLLGIESNLAWATPEMWSTNNVPCNEDGSKCGLGFQKYTDPATHVEAISDRFGKHNDKIVDKIYF
jgi:cathepsin X